MARSILRTPIPKIILAVGVCTIVLGWLQLHTPVVWAQRGTHVGGGGARPVGGARVVPPRVPAPHLPSGPAPGAMVHPRGFDSPGLRTVGTRTLIVPFSPIRGFRRPFFHGRFFRFAPTFGLNSFLWNCWNCSPFWGFTSGCNGLPYYPPGTYGSGFENYVTLQNYGNPSYLYAAENHDLVWLYLKDGTAYAVTDYWFVDGEVHFNAVGEGGVRSAEQVIGLEELDIAKTNEVNTIRGFRVVMRDEPWEKYLKDHPDSVPPPLTEPPKK